VTVSGYLGVMAQFFTFLTTSKFIYCKLLVKAQLNYSNYWVTVIHYNQLTPTRPGKKDH